MLERPEMLGQRIVWVALLLVPLVFCSPAYEVFHSLKNFLAASLLWLAWLAFLLACKVGRARLPTSPLAYWLLGLTLIFVLAGLAAGRLAEGTFRYLHLLPFALGLVFCCWAGSDPDFQAMGIRLLLLTSGLSAAYGILQVLDLDPIGRLFTRWVQTEGKRGIFSTFGNPNFLAEYLVLCFPFALLARASSASRAAQALWLRVAALLLVAIVACGTRGVWLALLISTSSLVLLCRWHCPLLFRPLLRTLGWLTVASAIGSGLLFGAGQTGEEQATARLRLLGQDLGVSGQARLLAYRIAVEDMVPRSAVFLGLTRLMSYRMPDLHNPVQASPWLGTGLGTFRLDFPSAKGRHFQRLADDAYRPLAAEMHYDQLHNDYFQVLVEGGLLGLGWVLLGLVALPLVLLRRLRRLPEAQRGVRLGAFCAFLGPAVHGLVAFPAHLAPTALGCLFVLGIVLASSGSRPSASSPADWPRRPSKGSLTVVFLAAVLGVTWLLRPFAADLIRKQVQPAVQTGNIEPVRPLIEAGLRLDPWNGPLHFELARAAYQANQPAEAEREARLALHGINDAAVHTLLGLACLTQGKRPEGLHHLREAARISAHEATVVLYLAQALGESGQKEEAQHSLQGLLQREPRNSRAWLMLGSLQENAGALQESRNSYREAVSVDPGNADTWFNLGLGEFRLGQRQAAWSAIEQSLRLNPNHRGALDLRQRMQASP